MNPPPSQNPQRRRSLGSAGGPIYPGERSLVVPGSWRPSWPSAHRDLISAPACCFCCSLSRTLCPIGGLDVFLVLSLEPPCRLFVVSIVPFLAASPFFINFYFLLIPVDWSWNTTNQTR
ncbi:hypothetical protein BDW42DRAFT_169753 [Aspergillus taichungensis]|uniref:Uncharacterized protein n=1 Tax=Aspergillus taichungensis TaxID=482145 RepID=A0A2J5HUF1_9EURO|nr:hypothetical protein BDW42DRAFT_169753 [Aspergillus taichungensis]